MGKTIVAIGAHTGDAQLTAGMLLAKHAFMGDRVITIDLTAGERGAPDGVSSSEFREKNIASAAAFMKELGGESIVLDYQDGELMPGQALEMRLARILRAKKATAVLSHWRNSLHKDHVAAHEITKNAVFFASLPTFELDGEPPAPISKTLYCENWEDAEEFSPYFYIDVTETFPLWEKAIKHLWLAENSISFKYFRYYSALSIVRGAVIKKDHASCFGTTAFGMRQIIESI